MPEDSITRLFLSFQQQLSEIEGRTAHIPEMKRQINDLYKTLHHSNGRPSLIERVRSLEKDSHDITVSLDGSDGESRSTLTLDLQLRGKRLVAAVAVLAAFILLLAGYDVPQLVEVVKGAM